VSAYINYVKPRKGCESACGNCNRRKVNFNPSNKAEIIDALKADLTQMSLALCEPEETVLQAINNHELLIGTYEDKFGNKHLYLEYQDVGIMAPIAGH
jgi:hypothetical protein